MKKDHIKKLLSSTFLICFLSNISLGSLGESNVWAERRKKVQEQVQLARLDMAPTTRFSSVVLGQLPTTGSVLAKPTLIRPQLSARYSKFPSAMKNILSAIPLSHVTIQEAYDASSEKGVHASAPAPVVLIQDVHLNPEAQINIAHVLSTLIDQKLVHRIGVEGAFTAFNFSAYRPFSQDQAHRDVARGFLEKKLMGAPSYVGITTPVVPPFVGLDDANHYEANVDAYVQSRSLVAPVKKELQVLESSLAAAKEKITSVRLRQFDSARQSYRVGKTNLGEYLQSLRSTFDVSVVASMGIDQFMAAYAMEKKLDFARVQSERARVIEVLAKKSSKKELDVLLAQSFAYKEGATSFGDYYAGVKLLCDHHGISLRSYPNFDDYVRYVMLSDGIIPEKLFQDVALLEEKILQQLSLTADQKQLMEESEWVGLSQKLLTFSLMPKEWEKYKSLTPSYRGLAPTGLKIFERFYEEADIRSEKMIANMLANNNTASVMVVGGFHTPGITQFLRKKHVSYVVTAPKVTKVNADDGSSYLTLFDRDKSLLERIFSGEKLFINPASQNIGSVEQLESVVTPNLRGQVSVGRGTVGALFYELNKRFPGENVVAPNWNSAGAGLTLPGTYKKVEAIFKRFEFSAPKKWVTEILLAPLLEVLEPFVPIEFILGHNNQKEDGTTDRVKLISRIAGVTLIYIGMGYFLSTGFYDILSHFDVSNFHAISKTIVQPFLIAVTKSMVYGNLGVHALYNLIVRWAPLTRDDSPNEAEDQDQPQAEKIKKNELKNTFELRLLESIYGFLPADDVVTAYIQSRVQQLFPDVPKAQLPDVRVLAGKGYGVNAAAFDNGSIVISPEILEILSDNAEVDALLLHEINHLARRHHEKISDALANSLTSAGRMRLSEWEADALAFYQLSERKRQSNPQGAINLLIKLRREERFRQGTVNWDIAHGSLSDRILNLKSMTHLFDFFSIENELTPIPREVQTRLQSMAPDNKWTKLLNPPIDDAKRKTWIEQLPPLLEKMDIDRIPFLIGYLVYLKDFESEPFLAKKYNDLLAILFKNMRAAIRSRYDTALSEEEISLAQIVMLELVAEVPVLSNKDSDLSKSLMAIAPAADVLKRLQTDYKDSSDPEEQKKSPLPAQLKKVIEQLRGDFIFDEKSAGQLISWFMNDQLTGKAAFDEDSGPNWDTFFSVAHNLIETMRSCVVAQRHGYQKDDPWIENEIWTNIVVGAAIHLDDVGDLKQEGSACLASAKKAAPFTLVEQVIRSEILKATLSTSAQLSDDFFKFTKTHWKINLLQKSGYKNISDQLNTIGAQIVKLSNKTRGEWLKSDPNSHSMAAQSKVFSTEMKPLLQKAVPLIRACDDVRQEMNIFGWVRAKADFRDVDTVADALFVIDWMRSVAADDAEYDQLIDFFLYQFFDQKTVFDRSEIETLATAISQPHPGDSRFRIQTTKVRLENHLLGQIRSMEVFGNEVSIESGMSPREFFSLIQTYVDRWPWNPSIAEMHRVSVVSGIRAGMANEMLDLNDKHRTEMSEEDYAQNLLLCTFFMDDFSRRSTAQTQALRVLLKGRSLSQSIQLLFHDYKNQQLYIHEDLIRDLDKKAETAEDFDLLQREGESFLNSSASQNASWLVFGEAAAHGNELDAKGYADFLIALLETHKSDQHLRDQIASVWMARNSSIRSNSALVSIAEFDDVYTELKLVDHRIGIFHPQAILSAIYQMSPLQRHGLLRKILADDRGALSREKEANRIKNYFLENYVTADSSGNQGRLFRVVKHVFSKIIEVVPIDDLYLIVEPLMASNIALLPKKNGDWQKSATGEITENYEQYAEVTTKMGGSRASKKGTLVRLFEKIFSGDSNSATPARPVPDGKPADQDNRSKQFTSITLTLTAAKRLGAPGVRFLQLLGQLVDIPEEHRKEFLTVYDDMEGQSKLSAWHTIKREMPAYAEQIKRLGKRLGGGSLFTVFEVELKDGSTEAVRVLNPNAIYHARRSIELMREIIGGLAEEDEQYKQALPLVDLLEKWIETELADPSYDVDDAAFHEKWDGWKPSKGKWNTDVMVPRSTPTQTRFVRREQFIPGSDFTKLTNSDEDRELVALAVQNYMAQIKGDTWSNLLSWVGIKPKDDYVLVHSDLSPGNFRKAKILNPKTGNTKTRLALLDRGMYLRLKFDDRAFLKKMVDAESLEKRASVFVDWAMKMNGNAASKVDPEKLKREINQSISKSQKSNDEDVTLEILQHIHQNGLHIPLEFNLLFKNLNVLNRLSAEVGLGSMRAASTWTPGDLLPAAKAPTTKANAPSSQASGGLIGQYEILTPPVFDREKNEIRFQGRHIEKPESSEPENIVLAVQPISPDHVSTMLLAFRNSQNPIATSIVDWYLNGDWEGDVLLLKPNSYGIKGIGADGILAVAEEFENVPLAYFHELGESMAADSRGINTVQILDSLKNLSWFDRHMSKLGRSRLDFHYALRALQRELFPEMDKDFTRQIKGYLAPAIILQKAREAGVSPVTVLREFTKRRPQQLLTKEAELSLLDQIISWQQGQESQAKTHLITESTNQGEAARTIRTHLAQVQEILQRPSEDHESQLSAAKAILRELNQFDDTLVADEISIYLVGADLSPSHTMLPPTNALMTLISTQGATFFRLSLCVKIFARLYPTVFSDFLPITKRSLLKRNLHGLLDQLQGIDDSSIALLSQVLESLMGPVFHQRPRVLRHHVVGIRDADYYFDTDPQHLDALIFKNDFSNRVTMLRDLPQRKRLERLYREATFPQAAIRESCAKISLNDPKGTFLGNILLHMDSGNYEDDSFAELAGIVVSNLSDKNPAKDKLISDLLPMVVARLENTNDFRSQESFYAQLKGMVAKNSSEKNLLAIAQMAELNFDLLAREIDRLDHNDDLLITMSVMEHRLYILADVVKKIDPSTADPVSREARKAILQRFIQICDNSQLNRNIRSEAASVLAGIAEIGDPVAMNWFVNKLSPASDAAVDVTLFGDHFRKSQVIKTLENKASTVPPRLLMMLVRRHQYNRPLLLAIIENENIDIRYRLTAFVYYGAHFMPNGNSSAEKKYLRMLNSLAQPAHELIAKTKSDDTVVSQIYDNEIAQDEELRMLNAAVFVSMSHHFNYSSPAAAMNMCQLISRSRARDYYANATASMVFGGRSLRSAERPGEELFQVMAHEQGHGILLFDSGFESRQLRDGILHELVADLQMFAFSDLHQLGSDTWKKLSTYEQHFKDVEGDNFYSVEAHEGARAQLEIIHQVMAEKNQKLDHKRLLHIALTVLSRPNISDQSLDQIIALMMKIYFGQTVPATSTVEPMALLERELTQLSHAQSDWDEFDLPEQTLRTGLLGKFSLRRLLTELNLAVSAIPVVISKVEAQPELPGEIKAHFERDFSSEPFNIEDSISGAATQVVSLFNNQMNLGASLVGLIGLKSNYRSQINGASGTMLVDFSDFNNRLGVVVYGNKIFVLDLQTKTWSYAGLQGPDGNTSVEVFLRAEAFHQFVERTTLKAFGSSSAQKNILAGEPTSTYPLVGLGNVSFFPLQWIFPKITREKWGSGVVSRFDEKKNGMNHRYVGFKSNGSDEKYLFFVVVPRRVFLFNEKGLIRSYERTPAVAEESRRNIYIDTFFSDVLRRANGFARHTENSVINIGDRASGGGTFTTYRSHQIRAERPDGDNAIYSWVPAVQFFDHPTSQLITEIYRIAPNQFVISGVGDPQNDADPLFVFQGSYCYLPNLALDLAEASAQFKQAFGRPGYDARKKGDNAPASIISKRHYLVIPTNEMRIDFRDGRAISRRVHYIVEKGDRRSLAKIRAITRSLPANSIAAYYFPDKSILGFVGMSLEIGAILASMAWGPMWVAIGTISLIVIGHVFGWNHATAKGRAPPRWFAIFSHGILFSLYAITYHHTDSLNIFVLSPVVMHVIWDLVIIPLKARHEATLNRKNTALQPRLQFRNRIRATLSRLLFSGSLFFSNLTVAKAHEVQPETFAALRAVVNSTPLNLNVSALREFDRTGSAVGDLSEQVGQQLMPYLGSARPSHPQWGRPEAPADFYRNFCHQVGWALSKTRSVFGGSYNNLARLIQQLPGDHVVVAFVRNADPQKALQEAEVVRDRFFKKDPIHNARLIFVSPHGEVQKILTERVASTKVGVAAQAAHLSELNDGSNIMAQLGDTATFHVVMHDRVDLPSDFMADIDPRRYHLYLMVTDAINALLVEFKGNHFDVESLVRLAGVARTHA